MYVYIKNKLFWDKLFIKNTHTHYYTLLHKTQNKHIVIACVSIVVGGFGQGLPWMAFCRTRGG